MVAFTSLQFWLLVDEFQNYGVPSINTICTTRVVNLCNQITILTKLNVTPSISTVIPGGNSKFQKEPLLCFFTSIYLFKIGVSLLEGSRLEETVSPVSFLFKVNNFQSSQLWTVIFLRIKWTLSFSKKYQTIICFGFTNKPFKESFSPSG